MSKKKTKSSIPRKHRMAEPVWRSEAPKKSSSKLHYFDKRYYFNLKSHRWKRHIDGDWDNGPIISRVPLYPEQAVLSCCSASHATNHQRFSVNGATDCSWWGVTFGVDCCNSGDQGQGKTNCAAFAGIHTPAEASLVAS